MNNIQSHKKQTIAGLRWSVLNQVINQVATFGLGLFLMTLLPPTSFGLLGMVTVFSGFLSVFKDFGLGSSLIQRKDISEIDIHTLFWSTVGLGFILTIVLIGLSPIIASYYSEPILIGITITISFLFVVQSLSSIQLSLLKKQMNFKLLFKVRVSATIIAGTIALTLAYFDFGVWALVVQQLSNAAIVTGLLFLLNDYKPKMQFSKHVLKSHLNFSLPLVGRGSLNYWSRNADNFFIGKFLGAEILGIYTRSYSIMMLPISRISGTISSVMFPSLSLIQDDYERLKNIFLKMTRIIAIVTFPLMALLTIGAESFVKLLFNEEWYEMIPILQILAGVGVIQSVGTLNGNIFLVKSRTDLAFKLNIFNSFCYVTAFYFTSQHNLYLLVSVYLALNIVLLFVGWFYVAKLLKINVYNLLKNISFHALLYLVIILMGLNFSDYLFANYYLKIILITLYVTIGWVFAFWLLKHKEFKEFVIVINESLYN